MYNHVSFVHGTNIVNNGMMVGTFAYTRRPAMSHKTNRIPFGLGKYIISLCMHDLTSRPVTSSPLKLKEVFVY